LNSYLSITEPWKIKEDPISKGKILSYSMHCLVAIIPEFQPINPQFYKDLKGYFKDFVADSSIE
jgi:hypothetical protein